MRVPLVLLFILILLLILVLILILIFLFLSTWGVQDCHLRWPPGMSRTLRDTAEVRLLASTGERDMIGMLPFACVGRLHVPASRTTAIRDTFMEAFVEHRFSHVWFEGVDRPLRPRPRLPDRLPASAATFAQRQRHEPFAEAVDPLIAFILGQAGLDATAYRPSATRRRVPACLRALRAPSTRAAISLLSDHPQLVSVALDALLIGVSDFFRDPTVFDGLRTRVLPELARSGQELRVYSAGCSGGQELYSVAILLAEMGLLDRCEFVGADCRRTAIAAARAGRFHENGLSGVEPALRSRYFRREGAAWRVCEALRERFEWRVEELLAAGESERWNLILFRNVAIYLNPQKAESVWSHLIAQLRDGGILVTGKAERPPGHLPLARLAPCLYRKPKPRS